ncbi:MAG: hypothetical protein ACJ76Y_30460 [Thermoanaerobaculia bacterium]
MPKPTLTAGKKSALKKGPKVLKRAGRKAAGTPAIRREVAKALKQLGAISARLESIRVSLETIQENSGPGKPPAKKAPTRSKAVESPEARLG